MHFLRIYAGIVHNIIHQEHCRFAAVCIGLADQPFISLLKEFCIFIIYSKFYECKIRLIFQKMILYPGNTKL